MQIRCVSVYKGGTKIKKIKKKDQNNKKNTSHNKEVNE